jgi:SAM-dependent methyltransferase
MDHSHQDHASHHVHFESPEAAAHAEHEGEVLVGFVAEAAGVVAGIAARDGTEVRRVLDLGCGPGVGTCCLAERFASAQVTAADGSTAMLERAAARVERLGLTSRVETRQVEIPGGLGLLGPAEVVWASMVLHHVGDEAGALRGIRETLAPGGLLGLAEQAGSVRVLPDEVDLGRPGLWARLDAAWAAWFADMRADLTGSTTSDEYPPMLDAAGFEVLVDEPLTIALDAPLDDRTLQFAHRQLVRTTHQLEHHADPADLAALDVLIQPDTEESILRRPDARMRAQRHLYVARATP